MGRPIHKKLILPGEVEARGGLTIHVPRGHEDRTYGKLEGVCNVCGSVFGRGQEEDWQRHVGKCARDNIAGLVALGPTARNKGTVFDDETWDPEMDEHLRGVGKKMLREGRMVMLPNERANG